MPSDCFQTRICTHAGNVRQEHDVTMVLLHRQTQPILFGMQRPRASTASQAAPRDTSWCATRCCPFSIAVCLARPTHTVWSQPCMAARCGRLRQRISSATNVQRAPGISLSHQPYDHVYGLINHIDTAEPAVQGEKMPSEDITYRYIYILPQARSPKLGAHARSFSTQPYELIWPPQVLWQK